MFAQILGNVGPAKYDALPTESKNDTTLLFYKNPDKIIQPADDYDFIRMLIPADTSAVIKLAVVKDFYKSGKLRMIAGSTSPFYLRLQGPFIQYHENGKRWLTGNFEQNKKQGVFIEYYSNGKQKSEVEYDEAKEKHKLLQCFDTIGVQIAKDGNGRWVETDEKDRIKLREGNIVNGLEEGDWHEWRSDTISYITHYKKGKLISGTATTKSGKVYQFLTFDQQPLFRNSFDGFKTFLDGQMNSYLPLINSITTADQGGGQVEFIVNEQGRLEDIHTTDVEKNPFHDKIISFISSHDKEWHCALSNGVPCKSKVSISFRFTKYYLDNGSRGISVRVNTFSRNY